MGISVLGSGKLMLTKPFYKSRNKCIAVKSTKKWFKVTSSKSMMIDQVVGVISKTQAKNSEISKVVQNER